MIESGVCFDLHHTLLKPDFHLRPGTRELFEKLGNEGRRIILTTTGGGPHLQEIMRVTGLQGHFAQVFEGSQINVGMGKLYAPAAASLGLSAKEAPHKMIAIGDLLDDQPADIPIVFIQHPGGYRFDASLLYHVIHRLLEAGNNSFINGFTNILRDRGASVMLDGISVRLVLRDPREGGKNLPRFAPGIQIPTIRIESAEMYRR